MGAVMHKSTLHVCSSVFIEVRALVLACAFSWLIWLFIRVYERCVKVITLMLIRMQNAKGLIKTRRVMREYVMVLN